MKQPGKLSCTVLALMTVLSAVSCEEQPGPPTRQPQEAAHRAVIIGGDLNSPTFQVLRRGGEWLSRRMKTLHVQVLAPEQSSPSAQQELIATLPANVDMIFIAPLEPQSLRKVIADRAQAGAAVFLIGMDVPGSKRTAYCGPSDLELGEAAARAAAKLVEGGNSSILVLHSGIEIPVYGTRLVGFRQELVAVPQVHVLREIDCRDNWMEAVRKVRHETRLYPRAGAWVFLSDWMMQGLRSNEAVFPDGRPAVVLCDGGPAYLDRLRLGHIQALVTFNYHKAVQEAMYAAIAWLDAKQRIPVSDKTIPAEIITVKELESFTQRWESWQKGG